MSGEVVEAASGYHRAGWIPVPIREGTKQPDLSGWPDLQPRAEEIAPLFSGPGGVGLLLGEPSGGLVDVDLDCEEALALADDFLPPTGMEHGRESTPRAHRWYRCSPPPPRTERFTAPDGAVLLELRSTGAQTMVPPSLHPDTGERVRWDADGDPAEVEASDLRQRSGELAAAVLLARSWPEEGSRQAAALALGGVLLRGGWTEDRTQWLIDAVVRAAGDDEPEKRAETVRYTLDRLRAGEPATGGRTLADLLRGDGPSAVTRIRGWLALTSAAKAIAAGGSCGRRSLRFRTVEELRAMPESKVTWLVEGFLGTGNVTLLAAPKAVGKSTLIGSLLGSLERGEPFAGFKTEQSSAVYLSEESASALIEKIDLFGLERAMYLPREDFDLHRTFADYMNEAGEEARRRGARLLVIDTFGRFSRLGPDQEKDSGAVQKVIEHALQVAVQFQLAVLIVHHLTKAPEERDDAGESIRGSTALAGAVDITIVMRRLREQPRGTCRILSFLSRFRATPTDKQILELRGSEYLPIGSPAEADYFDMAARIMVEVLRSPGETQTEILRRVTGQNAGKTAAVARMASEGAVKRTGGGKKRDPFRLHPSEDPPDPIPSPSPIGGEEWGEENIPATGDAENLASATAPLALANGRA